MGTQPRMDGILSTITDMATKLFKGGGTDEEVGPSTETKAGNPLVALSMTPEQVGEWWARIKESDDRVRLWSEAWDILLDEYMPIVMKSGVAETVKTNTHFRNVHAKIGQLFYRSPDLVLTPKDISPKKLMPYPTPEQPQGTLSIEEITSLKQEILRSKLGRNGIKVERLFDELLFDCLAWSHLACSKIGYECTFKPIQQPKMVPAPPLSGAVLNLGGPQTPQMVPDPTGAMETVNVPVYENYYWRRFSAKKLILDADLKSTRYDEDATLIGHHFFWTPEKVSKRFKIPIEELTGKSDESQYVHEYGADKTAKTKGLIHGVELFVKAHVYTDEVHPLAINQLVLIEGKMDAPVVWRPSPDQEFETQGPRVGQLTVDSMTGFPIRILTIRDLADSPAPPSDAAFENSLAKQKNVSRRQSIRYRDAAIGKTLYDGSAFDDQDVEKVKNGEVGDWIEVEEGKLANGVDKIMANTQQVHASPDDYRLESSINQDILETLGMSNPGGSVNSTIHTATEIATVQQTSNARNDKELNRVVDHYLEGARMIDQLTMRYSTAEEYQSVVGEDGARKLYAWTNKLISWAAEYDIAPDSQLRADASKDFQLSMQMYNLTAKDPLVNRLYVLRRMARQRGWDPMKVAPPPPPTQGPKPPEPSVTISLKAEDIIGASAILKVDPTDTGAQIIMDLAMQAKIAPPPPPGPPPHGGAAPTAEVVSDHQLSTSGNRPNEPGVGNHRAERV